MVYINVWVFRCNWTNHTNEIRSLTLALPGRMSWRSNHLVSEQLLPDWWIANTPWYSAGWKGKWEKNLKPPLPSSFGRILGDVKWQTSSASSFHLCYIGLSLKNVCQSHLSFHFCTNFHPPKKNTSKCIQKKTSLVFKKASGKPWRVVVFSTSPRGFMGVYMFHHHQVVDLGEHILEGHGLTEDASRTGCAGRAKVQLIQLVPDLLAHAWSCTLVEWHDNFFFSTIKMEKKTTSNRKHTKNTKNCWLTLYSSFLLVGSFDNVGRTRKIILAI